MEDLAMYRHMWFEDIALDHQAAMQIALKKYEKLRTRITEDWIKDGTSGVQGQKKLISKSMTQTIVAYVDAISKDPSRETLNSKQLKSRLYRNLTFTDHSG